METSSPLVDLKEESPSQGQIGHIQPIKRDHESLDDFVDITKDVSPMKDVTAQFLRFEGGNKPQQQSDLDSLLNFDDFSANNEKGATLSSSAYKDEHQITEAPENIRNIDFLSDFSAPLIKPIVEDISLLQDDPIGSSKNFMHYEQNSAHNVTPKNESDDFLLGELGQTEKHSSKSISDDNKLNLDSNNDDDVSSGSDDFIHKSDGGSGFPDFGDEGIEVISNVKGSQPEPQPEPEPEPEPPFISGHGHIPTPKLILPDPEPDPEPDLLPEFKEPVVDQFEPEPKHQEPVTISHGDGLHVKEDVDLEASDNEFAPEPLPKDYPEIGAMEAKAFLSAIGIDTWFHPERLNPRVEALVYWRDPKKSGVVFGSVLAVLLSLTLFSLISVVAYTSLIALVAAISFRIYKNILQAVQKTSEGHPFKPYLVMVLNHPIISEVFHTIKEYLELDLTLNPDKVREVTDLAVAHVNTGIAELRRRFLVEDLIDSIKFGVLLWCLTYVGAWFNGLSLLIIAFVGLFTLPKVYENNKTQIDANLEVVKAKINEVTDKIKAVIPIGKKPEEAKDKDE